MKLLMMNKIYVLVFVLLTQSVSILSAQYNETIKQAKLHCNFSDYGVVSNDSTKNQSASFQKAIDEVSTKGGGVIELNQGIYSIDRVALKSNVHLVVDKNAVIKPIKGKSGNGKWAFEIGLTKPVENVSIRGKKKQDFVVSLQDYTHKERVRVIMLGDVTNFLISNLKVLDNHTVFSSIMLSPPESMKTGFVGATNGIIRDCKVINASSGYGLMQAHAAKNIFFKNLYAKGGVAMRLECGVRPKGEGQLGGLFDIKGEDIVCENGYVALLMGPHSTHCGLVEVDGVKAISCEFAVKFTKGFVSHGRNNEGDEAGSFDPASYVKNITAINGTQAQRSRLHFKYTLPQLRDQVVEDTKYERLKGPGISGVCNMANYEVNIGEVTLKGFPSIKPILTIEDAFTDDGLKTWSKKMAPKIAKY